MKAVIIWGLSASGKSTLAQEYVKQGYQEINRDNIRFANGGNWGTYKFTKAREKAVTQEWEDQLIKAIANEDNIVISDTLLRKKDRDSLTARLEQFGYTVEVIQAGAELTLEELWKRDSLRPNGVGHSVIYKQWLRLQQETVEQYIPDESLPKAIILDVDGTIADHEGIRSPFEWDKVSFDKPRKFIIDIVNGLQDNGYFVIVVSGRDSICREDTENWLRKNWVHDYQELFMRKEGDCRKDTIVKKEIFDNCIRGKYNVVGVLDDRSCVVRLWQSIGIPNIINVGNPWIEF